MSERLVFHGIDHGPITEVSYEDSYPDDEDPGSKIVYYRVWVKQPREDEEEDDEDE